MSTKQLPRRSRAGFTLIEVLVTLAIMAVLMTIGLPALLEYNTRSQLQTTGQQTQALLARARHMAVKQRSVAIVQPQDRGVIGYLDENENDAYDAGAEPLLGRVPLPEQVEWDAGLPYQARFESNGSVSSLGQFGWVNQDYSLLVRITDMASARVELVPSW